VNSKPYVSICLTLIAMTTAICGTVLECNGSNGAVMFATTGMAVTGIAGIAVPNILANAAAANAPAPNVIYLTPAGQGLAAPDPQAPAAPAAHGSDVPAVA